MTQARTTLLLLTSMLVLEATSWTSDAQAYSRSLSFDIPATAGGGGGRRFTGSVRDGFSCVVCHEGNEGALLQVEGLPMDGYEPEREYPIRVHWDSLRPESPRSSIALEWTDTDGRAVGTLRVAPAADWQPSDECEEDSDPSTNSVHLLDDLETARQILATDACNRRGIHLRWTAPADGSGTVRVQAAAVHANYDGTPAGDTTGELSLLISQRGAPLPEASVVTLGCSIDSKTSPKIDLLALVWGLCFLLLLRRRQVRRSP